MAATSEEQEEAAQLRRNLVEEIETPYRNFRYFLYAALGSGALVSFVINLPRLAANLSGINAESTNDTVLNLVINALAIALLYFFYDRDRQAQLKRLERIKIGGSIAALRVRFQGSGERVKLADLRRGRGRARRVVLVAASAAGLREAVAAAAPLSAKLVECDLLVVPVTLPLGGPAADLDAAATALDHIALPAEGEWKSVIGAECERAVEQGLDPESQGFTIIIKKNGRIGQRIKGLPNYTRLIGDVEERKAKGMDVDNI